MDNKKLKIKKKGPGDFLKNKNQIAQRTDRPAPYEKKLKVKQKHRYRLFMLGSFMKYVRLSQWYTIIGLKE